MIRFRGGSAKEPYLLGLKKRDWLFFIRIGSGNEADVVDASLDPDAYKEIAKDHHWTMKYVMDTHIHADYLSRTRELAAVSDAAHPSWRAFSVGVYRFWRDIGYAGGALMAGVIASFLGLAWAVHAAGFLTFL